jgi:hypothetical protein
VRIEILLHPLSRRLPKIAGEEIVIRQPPQSRDPVAGRVHRGNEAVDTVSDGLGRGGGG